MQKFENVQSIIKFYNKLRGQNLKLIHDIVLEKYPDIKLQMNKGIVGQILEAYAGRKPNSNPNPDIEELGVELKVLPVRALKNKSLQPKERSKIKSINYNSILKEVWETSEVKKKINNIIFFAYEQPTGYDFRTLDKLIFNGVLHFDLSQLREEHNQIKNDWLYIYNTVKEESADKLTESKGKYLGASTSGTGRVISYGAKLDKKAKERSYSFKHSYLKYFYQLNLNKLSSANDNIDNLVETIKKTLVNKNFETLSAKYNVELNPQNKSGVRKLINKIFNVNENKSIKELEKENITIKTIPINDKGKPFEAMSFPKFSLVDFFTEEWDLTNENKDEAVFKNLILGGFLFITIEKAKIKKNKKYVYNHWHNWTIKDIFLWKPTDSELKSIAKEWEANKDIIVSDKLKVTLTKHGKGYRKTNNLPNSKDTTYIHIRPHAKTGNDIDSPLKEYSQNKIKISWQSFWFNKDFIEKLVSDYRNRK